MRKIFPLALLGALAGTAAIAAPVVFNATGTFTDGAILGGTVVIDTATGIVDSADLTVSSAAANFTSIVTQDTWPQVSPFLIRLQFDNGLATNNWLTFLFPPVSLIGYAGGILCGTSNDPSCTDGTLNYTSNYGTRLPNGTVPGDSIVMLTSGELTAAVPEPASVVLFSLGSLALFGLRRRR